MLEHDCKMRSSKQSFLEWNHKLRITLNFVIGSFKGEDYRLTRFRKLLRSINTMNSPASPAWIANKVAKMSMFNRNAPYEKNFIWSCRPSNPQATFVSIISLPNRSIIFIKTLSTFLFSSLRSNWIEFVFLYRKEIFQFPESLKRRIFI